MDEARYSDDVLNTVDGYEEEDFDNEDFTPPAEGDHEVEIESVKGYMHDFKEYTGPRAKLKMKVVGPEGSSDIGRYVFDDINLPCQGEKPGNRKRRALVLSRLGFLTRGDDNSQVKFDWKRLVGLRCIVTVEHNTGTNNDGKTRTYANVPFGGYKSLEGAPELAAEDSASTGNDDFSDL